MVRARGIFGVDDAVVVTQGFHMPRALYLADAAGIDATGLTADLHPWGYQGTKSDVREVLSRVKAIADTTLDTPAMGGPTIPISGDDGRVSWGPPPPPGTPPAGSPATGVLASSSHARWQLMLRSSRRPCGRRGGPSTRRSISSGVV